MWLPNPDGTRALVLTNTTTRAVNPLVSHERRANQTDPHFPIRES